MTWLPSTSMLDTAWRYRAPRSNERSPAAARRSASVTAGRVAVATPPFNSSRPTFSKMAAEIAGERVGSNGIEQHGIEQHGIEQQDSIDK
jgi:hypothetical protein